jgi:CheY-like chemotaxis protein
VDDVDDQRRLGTFSRTGYPVNVIPKLTPAQMGADAEPFPILLVDDDPDCRLLVRDAIAESKVANRVFECANGMEALEYLAQCGTNPDRPRPGLIFLDIEMPGMDGQDCLRRIRSNAEFKDIPVVMMTGVSDEAEMRRAAEAGANSYTLKPANAGQFLKTVMASTNYWLTIHQYPNHHLPADQCRR